MRRFNTIFPVFLPHAGCPFQCVYCNQHAVVSSSPGRPTGGERAHLDRVLPGLIEEARRRPAPGEIAFYGGTFTALSTETLEYVLDAATRWVEAGVFSGIRFSTRPDGISIARCSLLHRYPIQTVELGAQSLSDGVLHRSRRGYSAEAVRSASARVRENGWDLGIQLMPGLPGDTRSRFLESVRATIALEPAFVRLYPTIVLEGTPLAAWYREGRFEPLSLEEAIRWCAEACESLRKAGIPVARMGLHADPELRKPDRIVAGPYHPSFGYLVQVHRWREKLDRVLAAERGAVDGGRCCVRVPRHRISEVLGPGRSNVVYWREKWHLKDLWVEGVPGWSAERLECFWE